MNAVSTPHRPHDAILRTVSRSRPAPSINISRFGYCPVRTTNDVQKNRGKMYGKIGRGILSTEKTKDRECYQRLNPQGYRGKCQQTFSHGDRGWPGFPESAPGRDVELAHDRATKRNMERVLFLSTPARTHPCPLSCDAVSVVPWRVQTLWRRVDLRWDCLS